MKPTNGIALLACSKRRQLDDMFYSHCLCCFDGVLFKLGLIQHIWSEQKKLVAVLKRASNGLRTIIVYYYGINSFSSCGLSFGRREVCRAKRRIGRS